jgi:alkylated DNA repair dioxygenase AlkB
MKRKDESTSPDNKKTRYEVPVVETLQESRKMAFVPPKLRKSTNNFMDNATFNKALDSSNENFVIRINNALPENIIVEYIESACNVQRKQGKAGFGHDKPRAELCYSPDGKPYVYSNISHPTTTYPDHVLKIQEHIVGVIEAYFKDVMKKEMTYKTLSTGVDIEYSSRFNRGGSILAHSDDEDSAWGMVVVFSLGQTRVMKFKSKCGARAAADSNVNVAMHDNSIVIMHGIKFQSMYTHQVDKLAESDPVGVRFSLNFRYK